MIGNCIEPEVFCCRDVARNYVLPSLWSSTTVSRLASRSPAIYSLQFIVRSFPLLLHAFQLYSCVLCSRRAVVLATCPSTFPWPPHDDGTKVLQIPRLRKWFHPHRQSSISFSNLLSWTGCSSMWSKFWNWCGWCDICVTWERWMWLHHAYLQLRWQWASNVRVGFEYDCIIHRIKFIGMVFDVWRNF